MWKTELVRIVRALINDLDPANYSYSDSRIQEVILVSGQLLLGEVNFSTTYTVDVDQVLLTPDPTEGTKDNAFINLVTLKSACQVDQWIFRGSARKAIKVVDGKSQIDMSKIVDAQKVVLEIGACKLYADAKTDYLLGDAAPGEVILGPMKSPNFLYYNYGGVYSHGRDMFN